MGDLRFAIYDLRMMNVDLRMTNDDFAICDLRMMNNELVCGAKQKRCNNYTCCSVGATAL